MTRTLTCLSFTLALAFTACAHYPEGDDGNGDPDGGACTGASCPTDGGGDDGMPPECSCDEDCAACGQTCVDGACTQTSCCGDSDCPNGQTCDDGTCVTPPECSCDGDCSCGNVCQDDACTPGCDGDRDCCGDDVCHDDACVPQPPPCDCNDDCPSGEVCRYGQCEPHDCDGGSHHHHHH